MGKNLIQQKRGKGSPTYRAPSFRWAGRAQHPRGIQQGAVGEIKDIIHSQGHSAPLMIVEFQKEQSLMIAPEGVRVGDSLPYGHGQSLIPGMVMKLRDVPEGASIFNIESKPGDGGKFVRASGTFAKVLSKANNKVLIKFPSKKEKEFPGECSVCIGQVAGSGRTEKPLLKAGKAYHKKKAKNKLYPIVSGTSMNAVNHPFGGKGSHTKGRPTQAPRSAPPGRKVGKIAPRRTGRKNR